MLLKPLVQHFDTYERLPIPVNVVRDQIVDLGVQDEITFHFVETDPSILRGLIYRFVRHSAPYSAPRYCSHICISKNMEPEWQRVVAVKELLHITDTSTETAESEGAVEKLLERMALPFEIREETNSSFNDRARILPALAILVPKECRTILRDLRSQDKITPLDVARMAKIPDRYGALVISEQFEEVVASIVNA